MPPPSRAKSGSGGEGTSGDDMTTPPPNGTIGGIGGNPPPVPFAEENGQDPPEICTKADTVKVPFDKKDPVYWFRRLEIQMQIRQIKSQFWKRVVLEANLPAEMNETIKDLLIKEQSESASVYIDCKKRILKLYGPKAENNIALAQGLVMTGLPSQAGKRIRELVCTKPKFGSCCCPAVVGKFWRDLLPQTVKTAVASFDLTTDKGFEDAMDHADQVFNSMGKSVTVAAVDLDETAPALQHDVAAFKKVAANLNANRGQKPKKKKFDPTDRDTWGKPHKDFKGQTPPNRICLQHWRFGKSAHFCRDIDNCPWNNHTSKPNQ